ncbi:MAG: hypothetical protein MUP30_01025 [Deltaproteobacteria bacterium]|nr:hypothetical protein [Deltaproteobacteria bacterium]
MKEKSLQENDDRSCRVWFLPKAGWQQVRATIVEKTHLETAEWKQICKKGYNADIEKKVPHIFLSRSPLTFGHSQLVIPSPPCSTKYKISEAGFFEIASVIIVRVLQTFKEVFPTNRRQIHEEDTFKSLAESTYSYGKYIKTLVVRASAKEDVGEQYKVHLVPFFESHKAECLKRFRTHHRVRPDKRGGLIGWLGDRETEVDKWESEWCWSDVSHDDITNKVWNLPRLASRLNQKWLQKYQSVVQKV